MWVLEEEKSQGPEADSFVSLKLSESPVTLVFMNPSPKARVPLGEPIQTEFLHIWKRGPDSGITGHSEV